MNIVKIIQTISIVILSFILMCLTACGTQNGIPKKETESNSTVSSAVSESSTQSTDTFDIAAYATKNGYSSYFADAVNPIHWLLISDNGIAELTAVSGIEKVNTIPFSAISNYESTATPVFNRLTVHDKSGGKIEINLTPDNCNEAIKQIENALN